MGRNEHVEERWRRVRETEDTGRRYSQTESAEGCRIANEEKARGGCVLSEETYGGTPARGKKE